MPQDHVVALSAELDSIATRLIAVSDSSERAALLDEMRAILQNVQVLIRAAESQSPVDSTVRAHSVSRTEDFPS